MISLAAQTFSAFSAQAVTDGTAVAVADTLFEACGADPSWMCRQVFDLTDNAAIASLVGWLVERPLKIVMILLLAWLARRVAHRGVDRLVNQLMKDRKTEAEIEQSEYKGKTDVLSPAMMARRLSSLRERSERSRQRAQTLGTLFKSVTTAVVGSVAIFMVLGELGVNLGPLIAGAGILGVAIGFGSQAVVADLLTGIFMLIEDQYGVGDSIDVGEASGTVESVGLRTTRIRSLDGTLWHVPNGVIKRVGNRTQGWARAVLEIDVAYDTDIERAMDVIKGVADELWAEHIDEMTILEEPTMSGVQNLGADGVTIRLVVKTEPSEQWGTSRELRKRIKKALDEAGIEIPFPQRTIWVRNEGASSPEPA